MNNIFEKFKNLVNDAEAELKISVNPGLKTTVYGDGNTIGLLMAMLSIANVLSKKGGTIEDALNAAIKLSRLTGSVVCESEEQMNVMEAIIKTGIKPEDLQK
jgi:hypothetical protein